MSGTTAPARSKDGSVHVTDERINTLSHLAATCFALLGAAVLITQAATTGDPWRIVGASIYSASLVTLFVCSTLHHGLDLGERGDSVLRTLDYTAVFGLIAGTVTPLVLVQVRTSFGWAVLGAVWAIAIGGIVARSVRRDLPKEITNTLYIVLGWLPVALLAAGVTFEPGMVALLAAGGLVYSAGFVVFILERPNPWPGVLGFHEIWHVLVAIAAALHWFMVAVYVIPQ
ncbi:PAQR family membrane homeostasis protein TrhA [Kytococcus sedentarius]|uniref:PAQR family membrane homeostasis protein TrhA n=1 Tax=Kytococcus sedentarius TaxID=1276 RepID=UPI00194FE86F|nr:hemolysin III family protein [Kytococcus sedentarius]QRO87694.1 hemolysin III family protein [Kytococcus sedentarius]